MPSTPSSRTDGSETAAARPLVVLKFGGTALGSAEVLKKAARIVARRAVDGRVVVVVSAAGGVTDRLVQAADAVAGSSAAIDEWVEHIEARYQALSQAVLRKDVQRRYDVFARVHLAALRRALREVAASGGGGRERDQVLVAGERLMAPLATLLIEQEGVTTTVADAASLIRTDDSFGEAVVNWEVTYRKLRKWNADLSGRITPVVTGFIGSTEGGTTTTLGRGGTDYTAALVAAALRADRLERWTDVDGLYTADPRSSDDAEALDHMPLEEATSWNRKGRLGMHRSALDPLLDADVPVHVRSIYAPDHQGTVLTPAPRRLAS